MANSFAILDETLGERAWRLVVDHNPFYLLSAACMMIGCLTLANSSSYAPISDRRLLQLIGTLNAYELLLVALGIWLIRWRGELRDGVILLAIEAAFMVDAAMLNAELFTVNLHEGLVINAALLVLAAVKLAVIFRGLRIGSTSIYALLIAFLLALFGLPGLFNHLAHLNGGNLSARAIFGSWWIVAALIVASASALAPLARLPYRRLLLTFVVFALASLLLHLRLTNWVYNLDWRCSNLAPIALALAVFVGVDPLHWWRLQTRVQTQLIFPLVALWLAWVGDNGSLGFEWIGGQWSPLRLVGLGVLMVYVHGFVTHRRALFALAAGVCLATAALGSSPREIWDNLGKIYNFCDNGAAHLLPATPTGWGILSIIGAFALLALGVAVSLLKRPTEQGAAASPPPPPVPPPAPRAPVVATESPSSLPAAAMPDV